MDRPPHEPPFDSKWLQRRLREAGHSVGMSGSLFASELAESVLHLVRREFESRAVTGDQFREAVVKYVRELGHPMLALELQSSWEQFDEAECTSDKRAVFSPEAMAAHHAGLIRIADVNYPTVMLGGGIDVPLTDLSAEAELIRAIANSQRRFSQYIELSVPESVSARREAASWTATLRAGLELAKMRGIVHVSRPTGVARGDRSLFPAPSTPGDLDERRAFWLESLSQPGCRWLQTALKLTASDLSPNSMRTLLQPWFAARATVNLTWSRGGESPWRYLDADDHSGVVSLVHIDLAQVFDRERGSNFDRFLERVGGFVGLAHSVGRAKQLHIRRTISNPGFLLDRACVVVVPHGLDEVARRIDAAQACRITALMTKSLRSAAAAYSSAGLGCVVADSPLDLGGEADPATLEIPANIRAVRLLFSTNSAGSLDKVGDLVTQLYRQSAVRRLALIFEAN